MIMKQKRVLQIISSMDVGGAETMLMNIYRALNKDKFQFDFFISDSRNGFYENEILSMGGNIYKTCPKSKNPFKYAKDLKHVLKLNQYDTIHVHASNAKDFFTLTIAKSQGIMHRVYHSHNTRGENVIVHFISRLLLNRVVTHKLACSDLAAKWMYGNSKSITIFNPIDVDKFTFSDEDRKNIRLLHDIEEKKVYIHVGRFFKQKNHLQLLDIFKEIVNIDSSSVLLLIGKGPLEKDIIKKIKDEGLDQFVMLLGQKDNVHQYLSASDCFIMPSLFEGFPVTIVETQANGLPSLLSNVITTEAKQTSLVTYLPLKESPIVWANTAIEMSLNNCNDRKKNISHLKKIFDSKIVARQLEDIYNSKE